MSTTGETTSIRIYNSIKDACLSFNEVKQFNLWNNQISKLKQGEVNAIRFPAIFVQFENEYNQLGVGRQEINGTFILYICLQSLKLKDEQILSFKDHVYYTLLNELPKKGFQDFYRRFELQDNDYDNLIVWQQEYSYGYIDTPPDAGSQSLYPYNINTDTHY